MTYVITGFYLFCLAALSGLAILVLSKNPTAALNRYFTGFAVTAGGWVATLYFFNRHPDTPFLTTLGRINFAFAACFILFYYLILPEIARRKNHYLKWQILETMVLVGLTVFTPLIDTSEHLRNGRHITDFGPLFLLFIAHVIGYVGSALYLTFFVYRQKSTKRIRSQLTIIGLGIFVMGLIAIVTNLVLPFYLKIFTFQEIGALSIIALIGTIAYAILTHQLFDIRIVVRRTVVFTALFAFIIITYSVSALILREAIVGEAAALDFKSNIVNLLTICVIGFAIEPLRRWLTIKTDRFLFKREYDMQEVIAGLTKELIGVINLDEALALLMQTLVKVMHLRHAVVYVFQPGEHGDFVIKRIRQSGYSHPSRLMQDAGSDTIQYFLDKPAMLLKRTLDAELADEDIILKTPRASSKDIGLISTFVKKHALKLSVSEKMDELKAAIAIPLFVGKQPIGLIFLSDKKSGESHSEDDLSLLETIGSQTINAIQKAKLYEDDQAKSEFVSIASHELLTPIAAIQGYLSMILEEHMGKIDAQTHGYLEKVYSSTKRLRFLVNDLLSVSRIEAGRIKIELQSIDMVKTIKEVIDQLQFLADEKQLKIKLNKPTDTLPPVLADSDRLMEVLINLIGNSIKYTQEGSITIDVEQTRNGLIHVDITDTGIGMSKEAQAHLFEKFYRISSPETTGITGTGLGLFITKSVMEKMGGSVSVKSKQGEGSTFSITIPIFQVETAQPKSKAK